MEEGGGRKEGNREICLQDGALLGVGLEPILLSQNEFISCSAGKWSLPWPSPCGPTLCWHLCFGRCLLPALRGEQRDSEVLLASYATFSKGPKGPRSNTEREFWVRALFPGCVAWGKVPGFCLAVILLCFLQNTINNVLALPPYLDWTL